MDQATERKLRELIDRHEIWQVLQRYCRGMDRADKELLRSCYFDDGVDDHGLFVGAVPDFIDWALSTASMWTECHHGLMNHTCDLDGDNAYCETYWQFTGVRETSPHVLVMGRYIDHLQRRNGEWRFFNRVSLLEKRFTLTDDTVDVGITAPYGSDRAHPTTRDRNDISYHRPPHPRPPQASATSSPR